MIFDSHAHLTDEDFDKDREELIENLEKDGIKYVLNPGFDRDSSEKALALAKRHENIYAALGTHPHDARGLTSDDLFWYEKAAKEEDKVLAIGEIGFDFYYDNCPRDIQEEAFRVQLYLADKLDLPVLIHMRDATEETLYVLNNYKGRSKGVIHCYSEDWENAKKFLDLGFYIALGGMVTFKNASQTREVAKNIPLDRLLLETDAPYLAPHPNRGKRNEPAFTKFVAEKIAELRGISVEEVEQKTFANTLEMLGL